MLGLASHFVLESAGRNAAETAPGPDHNREGTATMATEPYDLPGEIWKDVPGCRNLQASSLARIRSTPYSARGQFFPGIIRKQHTPPDMRPQLHVWEGKRRATRKVEALVCKAFHGPRQSGHDVAHANCDLTDNSPENLRWATRKENIADSVNRGRHAYGERHGKAKLTIADVIAIRERHAISGEVRALAIKYGVHRVTISGIVSGRLWKQSLAPPVATPRPNEVTP